ncbi:ABC transporter permease [Gellertiella hungarica]|nr:MlaE family lipid ABC transporter permease subunit [Gellertiella hungarica]
MGERIVLSGAWRNTSLPPVLGAVDELGQRAGGQRLELDFTDVDQIDTSGAWVLKQMMVSAADRGCEVRTRGMTPAMKELIGALPDRLEAVRASAGAKRTLFQRLFEPIGRTVYDFWEDSISAMNILGAAVRGAQLKFGRHSGLSPAAVVNQMDNMGVRAVPIIMLMSFLIGAIIAQQGAFQLRYFGAEIFVVDLVGILQLREVGVLLTAIMIAGRSGSAITAEIGSMKMREEVDALLVMGLNPVGVLIFPRLAALAVVLPLLTIVANFAALFGAAVVAFTYSGITFEVFLTRLHQAVAFSTIIAGMVKAPFMALVIGVVAAVEGLKVGGSAESLGKQVTASVVKSIFVVILMDGLFAMFYASIGF